MPAIGASSAIAGVLGIHLMLHTWKRIVGVVPPLIFLPFRMPAALFLAVRVALRITLLGRRHEHGKPTSSASEVGVVVGGTVGARVLAPPGAIVR